MLSQQRRLSRRLGAVALTIGALACRKQAGPATTDGSGPERVATVAVDGGPGRLEKRAAEDATVVAAEVRAAIAAWLAAQNHGDFPAYVAAYDAKHFKGVK